MKRVLLLAALCVATNLLPADGNVTVTVTGDQVSYNRGGLSATFDKNILLQSGTLKDMISDNLDNEDVIQYATTELLQNIDNQHRMDLLIGALKNNSAHLDDPTKPSPESINFTNTLAIEDVIWLTNETDYWDIKHIYKALFEKLTNLATQDPYIDLSELNTEILRTLNAHINFFFDLKMIIGNRLKYNIPGFTFSKSDEPLVLQNGDGSQLLYALDRTILLYNPYHRQIIKKIELLPNKLIKSAHYICNGSHFVIGTKHPQNRDFIELLVYNKQGELIHTIPVRKSYIIRNTCIAIFNEFDHVILYDMTNPSNPVISNIYPPLLPNYFILRAYISPDESQIILKTGERRQQIEGLQSFLYNTKKQTLIRMLDGTIFRYSPNGLKVMAFKFPDLLLYDTQRNNNPKIIHHNQPFSDYLHDSKFSPDSNHILLDFDTPMMLYDIQNETSVPIGTLYRPITSKYSPDGLNIWLLSAQNKKLSALDKRQQFLLSLYNARDGSLLKTINLPKNIETMPKYSPNYSLIFFGTQDGYIFLYDRNLLHEPIIINTNTHLKNVSYSPDKSYMTIKTDTDFILYPILSHINFKLLDTDIIKFLLKASISWEKNLPYTIRTENEKEMYRRLHHTLQSDQLFNVLQGTKTQRIKDFFAGVTHTVYKWFGWRGHDMDTSLWRSWQSEHALDMKEIMKKETQQELSKEDEKEEDEKEEDI